MADIKIEGVGILTLTNSGTQTHAPYAADCEREPPFRTMPLHAACAPRLDCEEDEVATLIARIAGHDGRALSDLHDSMYGLLHSTARRLLGSHECAQEVVGDVFVHVWQHAAEFDARRGSVQAWLCGITRHRAIDRWRRDRRHPLLNARLLLERVPEFTGPEQLLGRLEERASVHAALSGLSPLRQKLLAWSFFDGLSHEEISLTSGLPLGTVKSHLRRALRAMRTALPERVAAG